ncbi:MAG: (Fe-S)-binding protein [Deltaproteobacteria bacterium]|nr:(Fe-S)-binding protein [Deltaproteobacteria bacterium]
MSDTIDGFLEECSSCGQCISACPFLDRYGTPDEIIANQPDLVFLCTNCTGCDNRCPLALNPSEALFRTKERLIAEGSVSGKAASALRSARSFAERGHKAPFVHYSQTGTVFWPGCSLAGTSPETVRATASLLETVLETKVGLALDCCFDPLYQMGDTRSTMEASNRIKGRMQKAGINRVIVGCMNCRKVFREYLPELDIRYVLEVLPEDIMDSTPHGDVFLHHPCPFYRLGGVKEKTEGMLRNAAEAVDVQGSPACCGLGGNLGQQSPELAGKFAERVTMEAQGAAIVTSCMGCVGTFLKEGKETYHILDLITGTKPKDRPVSSVKKWANRLKLALSR